MAIFTQPTAAVQVLPEDGEEAAEIVAMPVDAAPRPRSYLNLSEEREKWLVEMALQEIALLSREMGRESDGSVTPDSWMDERQRNQDTYDKDLTWRVTRLGGIFVKSNYTWGDSARKARLLSARMRNDLMGTRPFFGAMTARNGRPSLTKSVEAYLQEEIESSNVPETMREGIRTALVRNEAVIKTTYFVDKTLFRGAAKGVFVDVNGEPVVTEKGFYVYDKDEVLADPYVEGLLRLQKDPSFAFSEGQYGIADFDDLPQESVKYDNVRAAVMDHRDFLCSLKVNNIHESRACIHLYEQTVEQLAGAYGDLDADTTKNYFDFCGGRTGAKQPIWIRGETEEVGNTYVRQVLVGEVYIRCDANEDGQEEEVMLVLDLTNQRAIYYDYLENHMETRPFAVIPGIEKVAGRWYGVGVFSKMMHAELYGDSQLNRMNDKDSRSASVTIKKKEAVEEWSSGSMVEFGTDKVYNFKGTYNPEAQGDPIKRYNLNENAQLDLVLTDKFRQSADLEFGIQSNQSASALGMNRSDTATGVMSIERDADVITSDQEFDVARGLEQVLKQAVTLVLENMDEEVLAFSEDGKELATLNREEVRSLEKDVKLLMTKSRNAELISMNSQSEATIRRYLQSDPETKFYIRDHLIGILQAYGIDHPDKRLPEITPEQLDAWRNAQAQKTEPPKPLSTSLAMRLEDLPPNVQTQALMKAGFSTTPEEMQQNEVLDVQLSRAEKAPFPQETKPNKPTES